MLHFWDYSRSEFSVFVVQDSEFFFPTCGSVFKSNALAILRRVSCTPLRSLTGTVHGCAYKGVRLDSLLWKCCKYIRTFIDEWTRFHDADAWMDYSDKSYRDGECL